jgi:hypothetical protein
MKRDLLAGLIGLVLAMSAASRPADAQTGVTGQEAHAIGIDAYLYF